MEINQSYTSHGRENQFKKYSKLEIEDYKFRLANAIISDNGIDCKYLINNPDAKEYISSYTEENILKPDMKNRIMGYTFKLMNMKLNHYSHDGSKSGLMYPIINKYKGYDLVETIFFRLNDDKSIDICTVPMIEKKIII